MAKLLTQKNVLIAAASFILIWYAVVHQRVKENMTDAVRLSEKEKTSVTEALIQSMLPPPPGVKPVELTADAKKFIAFLEQNPVTAIDDKFMSKLTELAKKMSTNDFFIRKMLEDPDFIKKASRGVASMVVANVIWVYADTYEKLKEAPNPSEFKEQMNNLLLSDPRFQPFIDTLKNNLTREPDITKNIINNQQHLDRLESEVNSAPGWIRDMLRNSFQPIRNMHQKNIDSSKSELDVLGIQKAALGPNNYPLSGSVSPLVNQIFDIAYKYYFGELVSTSSIVSGAWTALVATFGSLGAIAVVGAIVYFVFLR